LRVEHDLWMPMRLDVLGHRLLPKKVVCKNNTRKPRSAFALDQIIWEIPLR